MRRSFSSDDSPYVKIKKHKVINRLENLSNDLFYEIFEYLDGFDLLNAFSNLNLRFETLVNHSSISLKVTGDRNKTISRKNDCNRIILPNKHRLLSLHAVIECSIFDASFDRLECLTLLNLKNQRLPMALIYLKLLPCLYYLTVYLTELTDSFKFYTFYQEIFALPVLKNCTIFSPLRWTKFDIRYMPRWIKRQKPSSIEALSINHCISPRIVRLLLQILPKIRHLKCLYMTGHDANIFKSGKLDLPFMKQVSMEICWMPFDQFENSIQSIGERVEILKLKMNEGIDYLDAPRWKEMIRKEVPHLKIFDMNCQSIPFGRLHSIYNLISPFYSQFWIERQWFPSVTFSLYSMQCHIHPYRKQWFDQHQQIELDWIRLQSPSYQTPLSEINQAPSSFNQVKFVCPFDKKALSTWLQKIQDFISRVPFTQLRVEWPKSLNLIFEMMGDSMIHLDSLVLTSIPNTDPQCSSRETTETQIPWASQNHITKVKIESIINAEDLEYVMKSFSKMEYLEVKIKSNRFNVTAALQYLLTNQSMKTPHLRSICFDDVEMDRDILDRLRQVIINESAIRNYHLNCVKNRIFIQWNRWE